MLRGLPNEREQLLPQQKNYTIYNHLPGNEVAEILQKSEFIICRSGYTSVMELLSLQKKSILIPTPAQTEQEFLAQHLMQQGWCYSVTQSKFSLLKSVVDAKLFHYQLPVLSNNNLQQLIPQLVEDLLK
jgi:UDP-N-acetylglucosamine:LPS N-acetylglucosamine transferase